MKLSYRKGCENVLKNNAKLVFTILKTQNVSKDHVRQKEKDAIEKNQADQKFLKILFNNMRKEKNFLPEHFTVPLFLRTAYFGLFCRLESVRKNGGSVKCSGKKKFSLCILLNRIFRNFWSAWFFSIATFSFCLTWSFWVPCLHLKSFLSFLRCLL